MSSTHDKSILDNNKESVAESAKIGVKDHILEGPILTAVLKLSVPMFISLFFSFLYNVTNTVFLSYVDRNSTAIISGITLVTPIFNFVTALSNGLRIGVSTRVAISIGEKNYKKLGSIFNSGLMIATPIAVIILILGFLFCKPIIGFMAGDAINTEAINAGAEYLFYMLPGFALVLLGQVFMGMLWGEGKTVPLGIAMIISNIVNIILDPIFIFVFHMGPGGAGLATSISMAFTSAYVVVSFAKRKTEPPIRLQLSRANSGTVLEICKTGVPQVLSLISVSLSFIILNRFIGSIGQQEMNSWGLCNRLDQLVLIPVYAVSSANLVLIGQNYGKKNWKRIKSIYHSDIFYASVSLLVLALIYIASAPVFFRMLSDVDEVISGSILQVRIVTLSFLGIAAETISMSTFIALDRPMAAFSIITIRMFILTIPLAYISIYLLSMGIVGIFISLCIAHLASGCLAYFWVQRNLHKKYSI